MKNRFKKITSIILSFAFMILMALNTGTGKAHAASASMYISLSSGSVNVGDSVTVYVSISADGYVACDVYVSYDASLLQCSGSNILSIAGDGGGSGSVSFVATASGEAYISASAEGYDLDTNALSIADQGASVTILDPSATTTEATTETTTEATTETTKENTEDTTTEATTKSDLSDNNNLSSLFVDPGKLEPEFSPSVTEYKLQVEETVKKVNISAVAEDEKAQVYISGNEDLEKGANTAKITVTAENGAYKTYVITIQVGEDLGDPVATIDGKKYDVIDDISIDPPEGFTETTAKFDKWVVKAYESPNKKIKVICLKAQEVAEGEDDAPETWYYLEEKEKYLKKYQEYSSEKQRIMIVDYPMTSSFMLDAFKETQLKIGDDTVRAYVSDLDKDIYLVYGYEVNGDDNYYLYDAKTKSFMRYTKLVPDPEPTTEVVTEATTEKVNTIVIDNTKKVEDKGFFSKKNLKMILIGMTAMFLLLCIAAIALVIRLSNVQRMLDNKKAKDDSASDDIAFDEDNVEDYEKDSDEFFDDPEKAYNDAQNSETADGADLTGSEDGYTEDLQNNSDEYIAGEDYSNEEYTNDTQYAGEEYANQDYNTDTRYAGEQYSDEEYTTDTQYSGEGYTADEQYSGEGNTADTQYSGEGNTADTQYSGDEYASDLQYSNDEYTENRQYAGAEYVKTENAYDNDRNTSGYYQSNVQSDRASTAEAYSNAVYADGIMNNSAVYDTERTVRLSDRPYTEPTPVKKYDGGVTGKIEVSEVIEASEVTASGMMYSGGRSSKVTDDTIGIQLEDAIDNNSSVNVPPVTEESEREAAMRTRPYGIDSAFDVIEENQYRKIANAAEENTTDITGIAENVAASPATANHPVADKTVSAAAAAFANIRRNVEESHEGTVQNTQDDDIVFPAGIDK